MKINGENWIITKWCKCITDDKKDKYVNKDKKKNSMIYKFRLLDDDGYVYGYGISDDDNTFAPLTYYRPLLGVVRIEYKNKNTGKYEVL